MKPVARPMEFRAFHLPTANMFPVSQFNEYEVFNQAGRAFPLSECVLMQYTGMRDLVSVKTYEGDVLRFDYSINAGSEEDYSRYYRVIYHNGGFCAIAINETDPADTDHFYFSEFINGLCDTVVGNVYEHPRLLELSGEQPSGMLLSFI